MTDESRAWGKMNTTEVSATWGIYESIVKESKKNADVREWSGLISQCTINVVKIDLDGECNNDTVKTIIQNNSTETCRAHSYQ